VMMGFAFSHTDGDLEFKWIAFAGSLDLDHCLLSPLIGFNSAVV
jgi:hypothetical protein